MNLVTNCKQTFFTLLALAATLCFANTVFAAGSFTLNPNDGHLQFNTHAGSSVTKNLRITNTGATPLVLTYTLGGASDFALAGTPATTILGNGTGDLNLVYTPLSAGREDGTLTIRAANGDSEVVQLNGHAIGQGLDRLTTPNEVDFNSQVGQTQCLPVTIGNQSINGVTISSVRVTGDSSEFMATNNSTTPINVGENGTINVCYQPTSANQNARATLSFVYTSLVDSLFHGTQTVQLEGRATGVANGGGNAADSLYFTVTNNLEYNNIPVGQQSCQAIRIANPSTQAITIDSSAVMGTGASAYQVSGANQLQVTGGTTQYVNVCFTPTTAGQQNGVVTLYYTANVGGQNLHGTLNTYVSGNAVSLDTSNLGGEYTRCVLVRHGSGIIGPIVAGGNTQSQLYLTNLSSSPITVSNAQLSGNDASSFSFGANNFPMTIAPGEQGTVNVGFTPTNTSATGDVAYTSQAQLNITGGDNCGPVTVNLSGISVPSINMDTAKLSIGGGLTGGLTGGSNGNGVIGITNNGSTPCSIDTVTFYNTSTSSVNVTSIYLPMSSNFTLLGTSMTVPASVNAGGNLQAYIQFCANGQTNTLLTDQLYISTDQSIQPQTYQVQGIQMAPLAVRDNNAASTVNFSIMPNPTAGHVAITLDGARSSSVEIYDILGNKLAAFNGTTSYTWDGRDNAGNQLANGSYVVRVTGTTMSGDSFVTSKHIVVQH